MDKLPDLVIKDVIINPPIVQGGMGVRISKASLASAVSNTGALGVIASVGLGDEKASENDYVKSSNEALRKEIRKARKLTKGYLGVNIMYALTNFDSLFETCCEEKIDAIFMGAGIPTTLPSIVKQSNIKLIPIVSSPKAAGLVCKIWNKRYQRFPDAIVLEGVSAGGHLGFSIEEINRMGKDNLEEILKATKEVMGSFEEESGLKIPLIVAGGIFNGKDIAKYLKLGAAGVKMGTRFVCTNECDASPRLKNRYVKAKKEDIRIIQSPVGLPGRVIMNDFVRKVMKGEKIDFECHYQCLKSCDAENVNYCIADALTNASRGHFDKGFAMCGTNVCKIKKIVSVEELINELVHEAIIELK